MRAAPSLAALLLAASTLAACGGPTPPPKEPEPEPEPVARHTSPPLQMTSELGTIDAGKTKESFRGLFPKFMDCQKKRVGDVEVLSGDVTFFVRVGADGAARYVYLTDSDLGDSETERCLMDVVKAAQLPKPQGGEAEVTYQVNLPQHASRDATEWPADKVVHMLGPVEKCKAGSSATYRVTAYVAPSNGHGKAVAVGVAAPEKDADARVQCIVKAVRALKLPSPGSWTAKVSFKL